MCHVEELKKSICKIRHNRKLGIQGTQGNHKNTGYRKVKIKIIICWKE